MSRVLHVVESLDRGAVENWLLRTFREAVRLDGTVDWTFYCTLKRPGAHDDFARSLGARVVHTPYEWRDTWKFMRTLRGELKARPYDVLHCHHDFMSALYLLASVGLSIQQRIVHIHNTDESLPTPSRWKHRLLLEPFRRICLGFSNKIVGISQDTLTTFLNGRRLKTNRHLVRYYNIDESAFQRVVPQRREFLDELDVSPDSKLLLCLGRMVALKNPVRAVEIMCDIMHKDPQTIGVFVGEGDLLGDAKRKAQQSGAFERFRFLGWRDDTIRIMKCCDLLIFPRLEQPKEALGLVLVEAQAAGLPVLTTHGLSDDAIFTDLVDRLSLNAPTDEWTSRALRLLDRSKPSEVECSRALAASHFAVANSVPSLLNLYSRNPS